MDAKEKMTKLVSKTLGFVSYVLEEAKNPSGTTAEIPHADPSEMIRVTDAQGNEYLCPTGKLKNINFVSEREKGNCVDYSLITHHEAL